MISEKNENKRHCAKYIKNREQFCVFKQKQTISFYKISGSMYYKTNNWL